MALDKVETAERLKPMDLKEVTSARPPCITISLPAEGLQELRVRLKNAVRTVEEGLAHRTSDKNEVTTLLAPIREIGDTLQQSRPGVIIFRSPEVFTSIWTRGPVEESVVIADHFQIRGLLPQLTGEKSFYILALSQKHIRLLRCTDHSSEEVELPAETPTNLNEWKQTAQPDHMLDNRVSAGPSEGTGPGVMFGTGTEKEKKDRYLLHFYHEVDNRIRPVLRADPAPLVLAGVEYELALYHEVTSNERVLPDGVRGAPDGLKGGELHARALPLVEEYSKEPVKKALKAFDELAPERKSNTVKDIVAAAWDGRVAHLFLHQGAEYRGVFRTATHQVKKHDTGGDEEDLLNAAAVQTIAHGGEVSVLPGDEMPNGVAAAAMFRW